VWAAGISDEVNLLLGIIVIIASLVLFIQQIRNKLSRVRTDAIVERIEHQRHKGADSYHPIVRYEVNGRTYTVRCRTGNAIQKYRVGEIVKITYSKKDVENAVVEYERHVLVWLVLLFLSGLTILGIALYRMR